MHHVEETYCIHSSENVAFRATPLTLKYLRHISLFIHSFRTINGNCTILHSTPWNAIVRANEIFLGESYRIGRPHSSVAAFFSSLLVTPPLEQRLWALGLYRLTTHDREGRADDFPRIYSAVQCQTAN